MATSLLITFICDGCGTKADHGIDPVDWYDDPVVSPPDGWDYGDGYTARELCPDCLKGSGR